jgi:hypothetical protein
MVSMNITKPGFSRGGLLAPRPTEAGGPPLVGCTRLLIQFIRSYPPYRRPFLHPQPEDAPCRGDRDPLNAAGVLLLTANINACFQDTGLQTCQPTK